jgi:hypothetical protein
MYVYLLNAYLLEVTLIICKIVMLLTQNLYYRDNMAISEFHCPFDIYMNMLRYRQGPYLLVIYQLLLDLSHAFLQV